jgi:hypothetical protein
MNDPPDSKGNVTVTGKNLTVGGENLRWYYEGVLPNEINKYLMKQYKTKLQPIEIATAERAGTVTILDPDGDIVSQGIPTMEEARDLMIEEYHNKLDELEQNIGDVDAEDEITHQFKINLEAVYGSVQAAKANLGDLRAMSPYERITWLRHNTETIVDDTYTFSQAGDPNKEVWKVTDNGGYGRLEGIEYATETDALNAVEQRVRQDVSNASRSELISLCWVELGQEKVDAMIANGETLPDLPFHVDVGQEMYEHIRREGYAIAENLSTAELKEAAENSLLNTLVINRAEPNKLFVYEYTGMNGDTTRRTFNTEEAALDFMDQQAIEAVSHMSEADIDYYIQQEMGGDWQAPQFHPEADNKNMAVEFDMRDKMFALLKTEPIDTSRSLPGYELLIDEELAAKIKGGHPLYQDTHATTRWLKDNRAIINALTNPNVTSPIHELMHVWRPGIAESDQTILSQWSGLESAEEYALLHDQYVQGKLKRNDPNYKRYVDSEEMVARGLERVLAEGVSWLPPAIAKVFASLKQWFLEVYQQIKGSPIDVKLTPEVRAAFERMFVADKVRQKVKDKFRAAIEATPEPMATTPRPSTHTRDIVYEELPMVKEAARIRAQQAQARVGQQPVEGGENPGDYEAKAYSTDYELQQAAQIPVRAQNAGRVPRILWNSDLMHEAWNGSYSPAIHAAGEQLKYQLGDKQLNYGDSLPTDTKQELQGYMKGIYSSDMPGVRLASMRYGEAQRDASLLNYNRRYGIDNGLNVIAPYSFWYTRTLANWAKMMLNKPQLYSMFVRIKEEQEKRAASGIPSRLKDKMRVAAPWLPEWANGFVYFDPMKQLFPPSAFLQPFTQVDQAQNSREQKAIAKLREMVKEGTAVADVNNAIQTKQGYLWDLAMEEVASEVDDSLSNPANLVSMMFGPPLWASIANNLIKGTPEKISPTPMLRTLNSMETVGKDTPIQGLTDLISGVMGAPERFVRSKFGLDEMGEYAEVYIDRQLSAMAQEDYALEDVMDAMVTRTGPIFDQARQRAEYEQSLKTPGASAAHAIKRLLSKEGTVFDAAGALLTTAFPISIISKGELKARDQYELYKQAWKDQENGNPKAVSKFFVDHPEYAARLAQYKDPEQRMRNLLTSNIWDALDQLEGPNKYALIDSMGPAFQETFLDKNLADTTAIDLETLAYWSKVVGGNVPRTEQTAKVIDEPMKDSEAVAMYPTDINTAVADYWKEKNRLWPNISTIQAEYYNQGKSSAVLQKFPQLEKYWEWNRQYKAAHPEVAAYVKEQSAEYGYGSARDNIETSKQTLTTKDFEDWDTVLLNQVMRWVYSKVPLSKGARQELLRRWTVSGRPGGTFERYLTMVAKAMRGRQ